VAYGWCHAQRRSGEHGKDADLVNVEIWHDGAAVHGLWTSNASFLTSGVVSRSHDLRLEQTELVTRTAPRECHTPLAPSLPFAKCLVPVCMGRMASSPRWLRDLCS
jgi:hypothetical protein